MYVTLLSSTCSSWGWACQGSKHVEDSSVTYMLLLNCALKLVEEIILKVIFSFKNCLLNFFLHFAHLPFILIFTLLLGATISRCAAFWLLGTRVRISLSAWMLVSCVCSVLCRWRFLRRDDHLFRGVVLSKCVYVLSRNFYNEAAWAWFMLLRHRKK